MDKIANTHITLRDKEFEIIREKAERNHLTVSRYMTLASLYWDPDFENKKKRLNKNDSKDTI